MSEQAQVRRAQADDREFIIALAHRFADFELPPWRSAEEIEFGTANVARARAHLPLRRRRRPRRGAPRR